jgi:hypothetical protein
MHLIIWLGMERYNTNVERKIKLSSNIAVAILQLAGITSPNDESCHVFQDGDGRFHYDHFRWLDYPSMVIQRKDLKINKNSNPSLI